MSGGVEVTMSIAVGVSARVQHCAVDGVDEGDYAAGHEVHCCCLVAADERQSLGQILIIVTVCQKC